MAEILRSTTLEEFLEAAKKVEEEDRMNQVRLGNGTFYSYDLVYGY